MKNTAGEAKLMGAQSPHERPFFPGIQGKRLAIQKRETEVSPRLTNFVLQCTIN